MKIFQSILNDATKSLLSLGGLMILPHLIKSGYNNRNNKADKNFLSIEPNKNLPSK
jgi:hypothetical protein